MGIGNLVLISNSTESVPDNLKFLSNICTLLGLFSTLTNQQTFPQKSGIHIAKESLLPLFLRQRFKSIFYYNEGVWSVAMNLIESNGVGEAVLLRLKFYENLSYFNLENCNTIQVPTWVCFQVIQFSLSFLILIKKYCYDIKLILLAKGKFVYKWEENFPEMTKQGVKYQAGLARDWLIHGTYGAVRPKEIYCSTRQVLAKN